MEQTDVATQSLLSIKSPQKPPLSQYPIFQSSDIEEAQELISRNFSRHQLNILSNRKNLTTQYNGLFFENMALMCGSYGTDVQVKPESDRYFFTQTTLDGHTRVELGKQIAHTQPGSTVVVSPSTRYDMLFHKGSQRLITMFEREALEHQLSQLINCELREPLLFDLSMESDQGHSAVWSRTLSYLCDQFSFSPQLRSCNGFLRHSQDMLMSLLLEIQPHNYSHLLHQNPVQRSPRHVRRAIAYIEAHIEEPISLAQLASAVGVTARTLQKGFIRYTDSSPSDYIRSLRIRRVHEALKQANPTQQVGTILLQNGVTSFGHFSRAYKTVYGCTPSETLKKT